METGAGGVLDLLPSGATLDRRQWRKRHAVVRRLLEAHLPALLVLCLVLGQRPEHLLPELAVPAAAALAGRWSRLPETTRALAVALGLASCSAVLVHTAEGRIEAHFHFFVVVSVVAFYESWLVLGATVAFVVLHHLVLGAVDPRLVYGRTDPGAVWQWFLVHAVAIAAQCGVALAHWRSHERALAGERRLGRRLLQREAALQEAARQAEVLALAADVAHRVNTPVQYAADNARYLGEAVVELSELVALTRATLEALPCEETGVELRLLRERHREHAADWTGEVQAALGDCLAGLGEVSHLVVALQDVAGPAPVAPQPRRSPTRAAALVPRRARD